MIETVEHPTFRSQDFGAAGKKPGLSAIVRLRNEEDYAEASLNSIREFFDEIIVVFNGCTDRTPEIVGDFAQENPERVRAFHYLPEVFPAASEKHRREPPNSVHSLVHYCNFALSKASYQIRCKWDGDQIAEPESFGGTVQRLRQIKQGSLEWWLSPWRYGYWWYVGLNLWDHRGEIAVPRPLSLLGMSGDHGFWPAGRWILFKRYRDAEYLFTRLLVHRYVGCLFYHVKGLKKDRGLGNFQFDRYPESPRMRRLVKDLTRPELESFRDYQAAEPRVRHLPDPAELNIRPIVHR